MTLLRKDSILSVLVVGLLLVGSTFAFLPAFAASSASASATGASPATLTGVTTSLDYPIITGTLGSTGATRTVSIANPLGNTAIDQVTIVIPAGAAASTETASDVASRSSCNPSQASPALSTCVATAIGSGSGPYTVTYALSPNGVLIPGGATVRLSFGFVMESTQASSSAADSYTIQMSATDSSGATTILSPVTLYETAAPTLAFGTPSTGPALCAPNQCAGTPFTVPVTSSVSGLALGVTGVLTPATGATLTPQLNISPGTNGTFISSSSQTLTVNETGAGSLALTVDAAGTLSGYSIGGTITPVAMPITVNAGPVSKLSIVINGPGGPAGSGQMYNVSDADWNAPIMGSAISISTSDAWGNAAVFSASNPTTVTVAANTLSGQPAGFSTQTVFGSTYPYTPLNGLGASATATISAGGTTATLSSNLFYGVDYGSQAQLTASATGTTLSSGTSAIIKTWTLDTSAVTLQASNTSPKGGSSITLSVQLTTAQANVPIWFTNTTNVWTLSAKHFESFTSVLSNGTATASVTLSTPAASGMTEGFAANQVIVSTLSPTFALTNNSATSSTVSITTVAGLIAGLKVYAFFPQTTAPTTGVYYDSASSTSFYYWDSGNTATPTNTTIPSQELGIDVVATDAHGNPVPVSGTFQVNIATSTGTLSLSTAYMNQFGDCYVVGGVVQYGCDTGYETPITYTTPSSTGTVTITVSGGGLTGTDTVSIVSAQPMLTVVPPTTFTPGIVSTFTGVANASTGIANNQILKVMVSVNGGTAQPAVLGTAGVANTAWSFTTLLSGTSSLNFTVYDNQVPANTYSAIVQVPPIPPSSSFTFVKAPAQVSLSSAYPVAINATITNAQAQSITAVVVAVVSNSAGQQGIFTGTVTVAAGATASAFPVISGLASGTYTVNVFVLSTQGGSLSSSTTTTVTVS